MTMDEIKIGDKFWLHDQNRRSYVGNVMDEAFCYRQVEITGETSRSWVVGGHRGFKVPKKNPFDSRGCEYGLTKKLLTDKDKADRLWRQQHTLKLADFVRSLSTDEQRNIAKITGYTKGEGDE
tara:strand:+ start:46 stop:414 length:369 start_codon:yes stop_codon:yes gene_type:complete